MKRQALWLIFIAFLPLLTACSPQPTKPARPTETATNEADPTEETISWPRQDARERMVTQQIEARGVEDPAVLRAMRTVPRHEFVSEGMEDQAYADHPLPIGYAQTISQPYVVAWMTEALNPEPDERVLEIGTGSGYQAAVLAEIVDEVYTIEIVGALAEEVKARYERLGYETIHVKHADGYFGWEEHAPFDAVIVTAAPDHVPQPLLNQLAEGGRMVIPVGPPGSYQTLWLYEREGEEFTATKLGDVVFVPFTRDLREE